MALRLNNHDNFRCANYCHPVVSESVEHILKAEKKEGLKLCLPYISDIIRKSIKKKT